MKYTDHLQEARRLELLRALQAAVQYRINATLLQRYLDVLGHVVPADRLATDLAWLQEQGLVSLDRSTGLTVATLMPRGMEVAQGRADQPGVAKPAPGG